MSLADDIGSIVHAVGDNDRKDDLRALAYRARRLESDLTEAVDWLIACKGLIPTRYATDALTDFLAQIDARWRVQGDD